MNVMQKCYLSIIAMLTLAVQSLPVWANFEIQQKFIARDIQTTQLRGAFRVKNIGDQRVALDQLQIKYSMTPEGASPIVGHTDHAAVITHGYRDLRSYVSFDYLPTSIILTFKSGAGFLDTQQSLEMQYRFHKEDWSLFNQGDDASFSRDAIDWVTNPFTQANVLGTKTVEIFGHITDIESGNTVSGALVDINGTITQTDSSGGYSLSVEEADRFVMKVKAEGFADYSKVQRKASLKPSATKARSSELKGALSGVFVGNAIIQFPIGSLVKQTNHEVPSVLFPNQEGKLYNNMLVGVSVTQLYASNSELLAQSNHYVGEGIALGLSSLDIRFAMDVTIAPWLNPYEREDLDGYGPFTLRFKADCSEPKISNLSVWHLNEETGRWIEDQASIRYGEGHDERRNKYCYYETQVDHFTTYALAIATAIDSMTIDLSSNAHLESSSQSYLVEVNNHSGSVYFHEIIAAEEIASLILTDVAIDSRIDIRVTGQTDGLVASATIKDPSGMSDTLQEIKLPALSSLAWKGWTDVDNPSGNADSESMENVEKYHSDKYCEAPFAVRVRDVSTKIIYESKFDTPNVVRRMNRTLGFLCMNEDQPVGKCRDYEMSLLCPQL